MFLLNGRMCRPVTLLAMAMAVSTLAAGCSPKNEANPAETPQANAPAAPVVTSAEPVVRSIKTSAAPEPAVSEKVAPPAADPNPAPQADFLKLYGAQKAYRLSGEQSPEKQQEFDNQWKTATEGIVPKTLVEGLDVLAAQTLATGDQEYTFSFLFHVAQAPQADYHLSIQGHVLPANSAHLPENQRERLYRQWTLMLREEPTTTWKAGEYRVVQLKTETPLIPYNLSVYLHTRDEKGAWTANVGEMASLGWQWDVRDVAGFVEQIKAAPDFASLYALAPGYLPRPSPINRALATRWNKMTAKMERKPLVEGLDFLAVSTKVTGEKEYTFSFLLQPKVKLSEDYHLSLIARVDDSHKQHIKPSKPGGSYITRSILLYNNPTSQWMPGEFHVVQLKLPTEIIPYNLELVLQTRGADKKWKANPGNRLELGWQTDKTQ